jgi:hypothetical protein
MKICAMVDRSAGNESVGEMWTETAIFDESATISDVFAWAQADYRVNVSLAVLQEPKG